MIKKIKDMTIVPGHPSSTTALFQRDDLNALCLQPGATGRALIRFRHTDGAIYDAAVGANTSGPMVGPGNLAALPCPPVCPGGKFSFSAYCP